MMRKPNDMAARHVFDEVFDAAKLTSDLPKKMYWVNHHFRAPVYTHLNVALLNQLYVHVGCCGNAHEPMTDHMCVAHGMVVSSFGICVIRCHLSVIPIAAPRATRPVREPIHSRDSPGGKLDETRCTKCNAIDISS